MTNLIHIAKHIAFLGGGNMASAIATGLIKNGGYTLSVADPHADTAAAWHAKFNVPATHCATTPNAAWQSAEAIVLAVKPQQFAEAAAALAPHIAPNTLIISVMAGIPVAAIARALGIDAARIVRTMPNTPARIGLGITGLFAAANTTSNHKALAQVVLSSVGETVWVDEEILLDAVTALSGSGPAYVFYVAQAMTEAGVSLGLSTLQSRQLALATLRGAATLAHVAPAESLEELRAQVTSKGGTTHAAMMSLEANAVRAHFAEAMQAAFDRAGELGAQYG